MPIKASRNNFNPLVMAAFLAAPLLSAWAWHSKSSDLPARDFSPSTTTQRLPVEIIASDTQPKWVLVPIDPG